MANITSIDCRTAVVGYGDHVTIESHKAAMQVLQDEIETLRALLQQTRNYIDKDHYGMLAEVDAALSRT
jgi:hypothetical protein